MFTYDPTYSSWMCGAHGRHLDICGDLEERLITMILEVLVCSVVPRGGTETRGRLASKGELARDKGVI